MCRTRTIRWLLSAGLCAVGSPLWGIDHTWLSSAGGTFSDASNWSPATVPTSGDDAIFGLGSSYTVNFTQPAATSILWINNDDLTFALGGSTYSPAIDARLGNTSGDAARLSLSNGTLSLPTAYFGMASGSSAVGTINSGATLSTTTPGLSLVVGNFGAGTLLIHSGGAVTGSGERVGNASAGTLIQNGGSNTCTGLILAVGSGSSGVYRLEGGTLSATGEAIGTTGVGSFLQSGGRNSAAGQITVQSGSTYELADGSLTAGSEQIGAAGTFLQGGGSHSVSGTLTIALTGTVPPGTGTFLLQGGSLTAGTIAINAGGLFAQSPGTTTTVNSALSIGLGAPGPAAICNLNGGTLSALSQSIGSGTLNHNAGRNTVAGQILLTGGAYNLGGGTLNATDLIINSGTFTQAAGSSSIGGTLGIASGACAVDGGTFSAAHVSVTGGSFSQNAGAAAIGTLAVSAGAAFAGSSMNVDLIVLSGSGSLTIAGPVANLTHGMQASGGSLAIAGTGAYVGWGWLINTNVTNAGTMTADSGNLSIAPATALTNTGTLANAVGANLFVNSSNLIHSGSIRVNASGAVVFKTPITNGAGKNVSLLGGTLAAPSVTNALGGTLSGFGQITGDFVNAGSATFLGPTQIVGNFTNNVDGVVAVRNALTLITGMSINNGSITTSNGTIIFEGGISGSGSLLISSAGHLIANYARQNTLSANGTSDTPGFATIRAHTEGGDTSVVQTLSVAGSIDAWLGQFDLSDNDLIVDYSGSSPLAIIANQIKRGFANGAWTGNGITSFAAAANATSAHKTRLGCAESSALGIENFSGQAVDSTAVLVAYTLAGDANLDRAVDTIDFNHLAGNFSAVGATWTHGDFNYDGSVDTIDFNLLASNFGQTLNIAEPSISSPVPEPNLLLVLLATAPLARQSRWRLHAGH